MTINLINSIRANRANTKVTPIDCYGENAKQAWTAFRDALYDWSLTDSKKDASAAFEAGKAVFASINADLDAIRRIRFDGVADLARYRDAAVTFRNVDNAETAALKTVLAIARYRAGETDKASFAGTDYAYACKLAEVEPRPDYSMDADVAAALAAKVETMLADAKESKEQKQKVKAPVGVEAFRKACEVLVAEKLDEVMSKTVAELDAERKARNKARAAARKIAAAK